MSKNSSTGSSTPSYLFEYVIDIYIHSTGTAATVSVFAASLQEAKRKIKYALDEQVFEVKYVKFKEVRLTDRTPEVDPDLDGVL